jgi:Flp pilus assembly protein TadD
MSLNFFGGIVLVFGSIVSVVWLACLGQWRPIGFALLSVLGSTLLIGLVLMPARLLVAPAMTALERGDRFIGLVFGAIPGLYITTIIVVWSYFVLDSFIHMATPKTLFPVLLCSYSVAIGPWASLAQQENLWGGGDPGSSLHLFFLSISYIVGALAVWLYGATSQTYFLILAGTMGASFVVLLLFVLNSAAGVPKPVNENVQPEQPPNFAVLTAPTEVNRKTLPTSAAEKATSSDGRHSPEKSTESDIFSSEDFDRAYAAEKAEDWVELHKAAQVLLRQFPEHPLAWINLGTACRNQGKSDDALVAFRQATTLKPELPAAWLYLGLCHRNQGNHDDALAAYRQAIILKPDFSKAWSVLGESYAHQGKRLEALDALDHLRKLDPSQADKLADILSPK